MIALAPAVAINTAVGTSAIDIHIIIGAEPLCGLGFGYYGFGGDVFHFYKIYPPAAARSEKNITLKIYLIYMSRRLYYIYNERAMVAML
jgi:hypothetical protein